MRILYFDQYFKTPDMAGGTRTFEMARRLVAHGHEVDVVTSWRSTNGPTPPRSTDEAGVAVHWIPVAYDNRMSFGRRSVAFAHFALRASAWRHRRPPDVVLATSTPLTIAIPGVIAARRLRVPFVFEVRDLWPQIPIAIGALRSPVGRGAARTLERWAYRSSAAIVALSPGMKAGIARTGFAEDRIAVIPNASDVDHFETGLAGAQAFREGRPWLGHRPLVLYAGTLGLMNGVGVLVDLASELLQVDPDVRILVIGDGSERDRIEAAASRSGVLGKNFFMEPPMSKNDVPSALAAADVATSLFIDLPEMQVNSANKFFDALASSTPVLVNYGGWHHDLVMREGIGISIWKTPMREAAETIVRSLSDPTWKERAGRQARGLAERWFHRDLLANRLEAFLTAVVARDDDALRRLAREAGEPPGDSTTPPPDPGWPHDGRPGRTDTR